MLRKCHRHTWHQSYMTLNHPCKNRTCTHLFRALLQVANVGAEGEDGEGHLLPLLL